MPPTGSTLLGNLLNAFIFTLSGSYARTSTDVLFLLQTFATIELTVAAIAWAFTRQAWMAQLFWKVLGFVFLLWIVENWPLLTQWVRDGFIEAGLLVGGSVLNVSDITDPGNIVDFGFSVTALLFNKLGELSFWSYGFIIIIGGLAGLLIVGIYIVIAGHVFKALLEFYIASACLIFLVPFLAHEKTAPFGERVFGTFIAHALRLLILAAILSIALPILYTYKLPNDPQLRDALMLLAGSFVFFVMALSAPAMASGLISGVPVLSFSHLLHGASSAMQTAAAVGAVGAAASVAGAAGLRGALSGASAVRASAQIGAAQFRASHPQATSPHSSVQGGMQGVGSYAMGRLTSGFRAAVQDGRTRANHTIHP
jgi:P-type conjugative transfer protein TrbL